MAIFTAQENERLPKSSFFSTINQDFSIGYWSPSFWPVASFLSNPPNSSPSHTNIPDAHIRCGPQPVVPQQSKQKSKFKNQKPSQTQFKNHPLKKAAPNRRRN
jgi:hypothetical protein